MKILLLIFAFFTFIISAPQAATPDSLNKVYVTVQSDDLFTDPNDCADDGTGASCSLRQALEVVAEGGEVIIPSGDYCIENGTLTISKNVSLTGFEGADATFIGGKGANYLTVCTVTADFAIFNLDGSALSEMQVSMEGLSIVNGSDTIDDVGGVNAANTSVSLKDVKMFDHLGSAFGFYVDEGERKLVIEDSTFSGNEAAGFGGGISLGLFNDIQADVLIKNVIFTDNTAGYFGGGLYVITLGNSAQVSINLEDSDFINNKASDGAGILYEGDDYNTLSETTANSIQWNINNTIISHNTSEAFFMYGGGGATFAYNSNYSGSANAVSLNIKSSIIDNNHADDNQGGGVSLWYLEFGSPSAGNKYEANIDDSVFFNNEALYGGGVSIVNQTSGSVNTFLNRSIFEGNVAASYGGAVDYFLGNEISANLVVNQSTFLKNESQDSGAAIAMENYSSSGTLELSLINSTLSQNTALNNGGGIYFYSNSSTNFSLATVQNSTLAYNSTSSTGQGGGIYLEPFTSATLTSTILYGNESSDATVGNCDVASAVVFSSAYSYIPENTCLGYASPGAGDINTGNVLLGDLTSFGKIQVYPLEDTSVAINAGSCDSLEYNLDQRGGVRDEFCDIGAYEYNASYCGNEIIGDGFEEQCDDGNNDDGDGCSATCKDENDGDGDSYSEAQGDCDDHDSSISPSASDVCDGIDNDCDTFVDEGFVSETTTCGVGACASSGETSCVSGVIVDSCVIAPASVEICGNGEDDDCDGSADEAEDCPVTGSSTSSDSTTGDPTTTGEGSGSTSSTGEETTGGDSSSTGEGSGSAENGTTDGTTGGGESSTTGEEGSSSSSTSSDGSSESTGSDTSSSSDGSSTTSGGATDEGNPNPTPPPSGDAADGSGGCSLKVWQ